MSSVHDIDLTQKAKESAALAALEFIEDGMIVGLGSGSTAELFIAALGKRMAEDGFKVVGVATSEASARAAEAAGVPLREVEHVARIDVDVDGADEVDPLFNLIKGGGGCLLREKIIAHASDQMIVVVDDKKMVQTLGAFPLPVEVDPFGFTLTAKSVFDALRASRAQTADVQLRRTGDGAPYITDGGHYILDCKTGALPDPVETAARLAAIPGVVEHGLFLDLAGVVIVGGPEGAGVLEK
ncbi:MAG: ribose-5-phosphate isomerase RpiA [Maricaulaceae bacterium]|jgi:ribose 5-phosphate isomerase A